MQNAKNKMPIGVMDSGVGGLTVLKQMIQLCPDEDYIYFGDTQNLPYGEKTKEELIEIAKKIFDYFQSKQVKAVIMACNTTSATVYDTFKNVYDFEIYPIIQVVSHELTKDKNLEKIAIMATQATVNSKKYTQELKKYSPNMQVFEQACPLWVPVVEKKLKDYNERDLIKGYLDNVLDFKPQKIILGCTHYPYLLDKLEKYAPKDLFINPSKIFSNYIQKDLEDKKLLNSQNEGTIEYIASSNPKEFKENAKLFFEIEKEPTIVKL